MIPFLPGHTSCAWSFRRYTGDAVLLSKTNLNVTLRFNWLPSRQPLSSRRGGRRVKLRRARSRALWSDSAIVAVTLNAR